MPFGEDIFQNVGARTASLSYSTSQDDLRQKFTGYQKDSETQLDFAEARMYENRFGRFTAVDPLLASGRSANPQSFNRYVYTGNNPIIRTDPTGLDWFKKYNKEKDLWEYNEIGGDGWTPVEYNERGFTTVDNWCWGDDCGSRFQTTGYLYKSGGWDWGKQANYGIVDAVADTGISVAQFGWNAYADINNGFWWAFSRPSPFASNGSSPPAPYQIARWEAENQVQANGQLAMTGLTLYWGAAKAAASPRPLVFPGYSATSAGTGTAATPPLAMNGANIEFLTEGQIARIQGWANKRNTEVTLFGSRAKGTAHATSDFDYFVEASYKLRNNAKFELPRGPANSGRNRIDVVQPSRYPEFYREVLGQPHIVFKPN